MRRQESRLRARRCTELEVVGIESANGLETELDGWQEEVGELATEADTAALGCFLDLMNDRRRSVQVQTREPPGHGLRRKCRRRTVSDSNPMMTLRRVYHLS